VKHPDPTVLVLASGRGARFAASGGAGSKLQAQLGAKSVLQHTLDAVRASGLPWHLEDTGHPGMGDSIAAAVRATAQSPGWLILPGDLPLIQAETLRRVATELPQHEVVLPVYQGQRGHPVGFGAGCGPALMALSGERGASSVVGRFAARELTVHDAGCVIDVDTVADLQAAERLLCKPAANEVR
jgi:molybdenum cofactor cytidylyltransferase